MAGTRLPYRNSAGEMMPSKPTKTAEAPKQDLVEYVCERCGYHYNKVMDYPPYLCYRCMRFLSKRLYAVVHQLQPPVSRPEVSEV